MKINEILALIDNKEVLDKIYQFSYRRCNTAHEAEDLCSAILCAVISAIQKQRDVENINAFVWTIAHSNGKCVTEDFYGSDGIFAEYIGGFRAAYVSNIYGKRLDRHFYCGSNLSHDAKLLMTLRSIDGLAVSELTEEEKEIAAKALECGYLRRDEEILEPKIIVIERSHEMDFYNLSHVLTEDMGTLIEQIAEELSVFMKKRIPEHLMNEYQLYVRLIAGFRLLPSMIEECIKEGLLIVPENRLGAEGVLMVVER